MKIEDVQTLPLAVPLSVKDRHSSLAGRLARQIVIKILTDDGLTGIGEAAFPRDAPLAVCNLIEHGLKPYLIGEDPTQIEKLLEKMYRNTFSFTRRGLGLFAISGIEIALWDLPLSWVDCAPPRCGPMPACSGMNGLKRSWRWLTST
jgi:L-alanine-DL-glutamate epimerase-like enolase superfamily enzyme